MSAAQELVDIIDNGRTIGVTTRVDMRRRRLPHRCTYVLVFNGRGELFIHLRTPAKDSIPPTGMSPLAAWCWPASRFWRAGAGSYR
jgi:isopentenyldiphosphate isomerase